jgi:hypothetical protein
MLLSLNLPHSTEKKDESKKAHAHMLTERLNVSKLGSLHLFVRNQRELI